MHMRRGRNTPKGCKEAHNFKETCALKEERRVK
jgi:hypothetical protein